MNVEDATEKLRDLDVRLARLCKNERDFADMRVFRRYFEQFVSVPAIIDWSKMRPFDFETLRDDFAQLPPLGDGEAREILKRVAVIKLNGGLGTTMGCQGPKSLIEVRDGHTFLDFAISQNELLNARYGADVPLLLMESFRTRAATAAWLDTRGLSSRVRQFEQSRCPRLYESTLMPVPENADDQLDEGWYPPGHGNIFASLKASGVLDELRAAGRDLVFVSNVDNTAAVVDARIASVIARPDVEYVMEITNKTLQDSKGGTLIEYEDRVKHLELPHVPADKVDEFCSLQTFKTFNTNNIWIDLAAVDARLDTMKLEVLPNKKKLKNGQPIIQLESAIGGAIKNFDCIRVVTVPRSRFLPVKKTQDLLLMQSDAFEVDGTSGVLRLVAGHSTAPLVSLSSVYDYVSPFRERFAHVPSLRALRSLRVEGDVIFGTSVVLKGDVVIRGNGRVPDGTIIENGEFEAVAT